MELRKAVDTLYLYDPQFEAGAQSAISDIGGSNAMQAITRVDDIKDASNNYTLVKFLIFDTHGLPGKVCLPTGLPLDGLDLWINMTNKQFLKKDARILFLGCNIGEGCAGDAFLDEVGNRVLMGKGGTLGATTVSNVVLQLGPLASQTYMDPFTRSARLKVKRYDIAGKQIGSREVGR